MENTIYSNTFDYKTDMVAIQNAPTTTLEIKFQTPNTLPAADPVKYTPSTLEDYECFSDFEAPVIGIGKVSNKFLSNLTQKTEGTYKKVRHDTMKMPINYAHPITQLWDLESQSKPWDTAIESR